MASHRWNTLILVVVFALVTTACTSTGSNEPDPTATPDTDTALTIDSDALSVGETIVDRLGPDDGFAAVVLALDRGYDVGQVVEGAQTVTPDGDIPGVTPSGPPYGLFTESADALGGAIILAAGPTVLAAAGEEITIEDLERKFEVGSSLSLYRPPEHPPEADGREMAAMFVGMVVALVDLGYTHDQIVEGLILGEIRVSLALAADVVKGTNACVILATSDATVIPPESAMLNNFRSTSNCREAVDNNTMKVRVNGQLLDAPKATTTPSTEADTDTETEAESDVPVDGTYVGEATMDAAPIPDFEILESRVEITISDERVEITIDVTVDQGLEYDDDDNLACSAVMRIVDSGVGTAGTVIEATIQPGFVEVFSVTGNCEDSPLEHASWREGQSYLFTGTYSEGTITGNAGVGVDITAIRVP